MTASTYIFAILVINEKASFLSIIKHKKVITRYIIFIRPRNMFNVLYIAFRIVDLLYTRQDFLFFRRDRIWPFGAGEKWMHLCSLWEIIFDKRIQYLLYNIYANHEYPIKWSGCSRCSGGSGYVINWPPGSVSIPEPNLCFFQARNKLKKNAPCWC